MVLFVLSIIAATSLTKSHAHDDNDDYNHDTGDMPPNSEWMALIPSKTKLLKLSIPGTHDSGARHGGDIIETQSHTIMQQLNAGIRYLDIRARHVGNRFKIYHGISDQHLSFESVLEDLKQFLRNHESETVLVRIKQEESPINSSQSFSQTMQNYVDEYPDLFLLSANTKTTLGEARGMAVILRDFSISAGQQNFGIRYSRYNFDIQDDYVVPNNWELYRKWQEVKNQIERANSNTSDKGFINYLSASTGALPYFVASGHSSASTGAPLLWSGLIQSKFSKKYPDFPRKNCIGAVCSIFFDGINDLTNQYLHAHHAQLHYVGIMAIDFPGSGLINTIIGINSTLAERPYCQRLMSVNGEWLWQKDDDYKNERHCQQENRCQQGGICLRWHFPQGKCQYLKQVQGNWQWVFYPTYKNKKDCKANDRCTAGGGCYRWYLY